MITPTGITIDPTLVDLYKDLHSHPELGFQEHRTSSIVARRLKAAGYEVTTEVGHTGVVGVLKNGAGPTALLRADMDALPVQENTGLDYASTATATDRPGKTVPVAHACGHDLHTTCLPARHVSETGRGAGSARCASTGRKECRTRRSVVRGFGLTARAARR